MASKVRFHFIFLVTLLTGFDIILYPDVDLQPWFKWSKKIFQPRLVQKILPQVKL
jgi:hypothetical protein